MRNFACIVAAAGVALASVPTPGAFAQPAAPAAAVSDTLVLTLDDALARALRGEEMRLADARVLDARGRVQEAFSAALPQVRGSIGYTRTLDNVFEGLASPDSGIGELFVNSPFASERSWNVELTASQYLFTGGKTSAALKAARAVRRSAEASHREARAEIAFQVRRAYFDAAYAGRLVEIAEGGLRQAQTHLAEVKLGRREGARAEYDLLRAEVDAANQEPEAVAARSAWALALLDLKRLANVPLDQPVALGSAIGFADGAVPVLADAAIAPDERPAVAAAEADIEARRRLLDVERGRRWPDLSVSTTLSHQAFPSGGELPDREDFRRSWDASIKLEIPIFLGLRTEGQIRQAQAALDRVRAERDQLREATAVEIARLAAELDRNLALLVARRATVRQATRAHELAEVRFRNGMSTQLEVSDARLQRQTAEVHEVQATRDYLLALAQLERTLGRPVVTVRKALDELSGAVKE